MPETRPQPEDQRPFKHNWVDITTLDSPDNTWVCAGCGLRKTESKTHWPLYPQHSHVTTWPSFNATTDPEDT